MKNVLSGIVRSKRCNSRKSPPATDDQYTVMLIAVHRLQGSRHGKKFASFSTFCKLVSVMGNNVYLTSEKSPWNKYSQGCVR